MVINCCDGDGWYTSWNGGFAHPLPCEFCNPKGLPKGKTMTDDTIRAICLWQQIHDKAVPGELTIGQLALDRLETVLRAAGDGAGVEYPQTGFRGGIEVQP